MSTGYAQAIERFLPNVLGYMIQQMEEFDDR